VDAEPVLSVQELTISFRTAAGWNRAVDRLSFSLKPRETLAMVGESGCGKSVTALSLLKLVSPVNGRVEGCAMLGGRDLLSLPEEMMRRLRGNEIAMIFQEPMTSLNPVLTIGDQIAEALFWHRGLGRAAARAEALRLLERVRVPAARQRLDEYPHRFSGGMRQRVMVAMALACRPKVLIADEPTTALDVTVQAQILDLIRSVQHELGMAVLFITHDMGVVAEIADRVLVMLGGEKVEEAGTADLFARPAHSYTRKLLAAVPRLGAMRGEPAPKKMPLLDHAVDGAAPAIKAAAASSRASFHPRHARPCAPCAGHPRLGHPHGCIDVDGRDKPGHDAQGGSTLSKHAAAVDDAAPLLTVVDLTTRFPLQRGLLRRVSGRVHAVEQVSFSLGSGETLALVGESGCGKSTTARSILRLIEPTGGSVTFQGTDVLSLDRPKLARLRRSMPMIFQDPYASLDPRMTVGRAIVEPISVHGIARGREADDRVENLLRQVGLLPDMAQRLPHELSGGQRQRVCIARALATAPRLIIADEAVSALDVSIKAQVLNLMLDLQSELGLSYLFISHDMATVERISHRIAVMHLGEIVEIGPRAAVIDDPQHPYTRKLLGAVPIPDPAMRGRRPPLPVEDLPSPIRAPDFHAPQRSWRTVSDGHLVQESA
jgi:peptide/nickel transport system ATP-binding protein